MSEPPYRALFVDTLSEQPRSTYLQCNDKIHYFDTDVRLCRCGALVAPSHVGRQNRLWQYMVRS